jgi:hypothetical protein
LILGLTYGLLGSIASVGAAFGEVQALVYICDDAARAGQTEFIVGRARLARQQSFAHPGMFLQESVQTRDCRLAEENEITITITSVQGGTAFEAQTDFVGFARFDGKELTGDHTITENQNGVASAPFKVDIDTYHLVTTVIFQSGDAAVQGGRQAYALPSAGVGIMDGVVDPWLPASLAGVAALFAVASIRFRHVELPSELRSRLLKHED